MTNRTLLGMLTPSSNTVLEPVSSAMTAACPGVSIHFSRFQVTKISLEEGVIGQFNFGPMLAAAELLADAHVQAICWNGTSSGWLGLQADKNLCQMIQDRTSVPATSSVLTLLDAFRKIGATRIGLVTPYLHEVQDKIVENFHSEGFDCIAERHLNDADNFSFSQVSESTIAEMVRAVARERPHAITIFCTNLRGARIAAVLEKELDIPIYDTVATAVFGALRIAGKDPAEIEGWGSLFQSSYGILARKTN